MAVLTERAIKHLKVAVILVENLLENVPKGDHDVEFEWFNTVAAAEEWMDPYTEFLKEDAAEAAAIGAADPALAYLTILVPDTATMVVGKHVLEPVNAVTTAWRDGILADLTTLYTKTEDQPEMTDTVNSDAPDFAEAFLLTWNPTNWDGDVEEEFLNEVVAGNLVDGDWSTGRTSSAISIGDKVYLLRHGSEPRGLIALGTVTSAVWQGDHWDGSGRSANYADVRWTQAVPLDSALPLTDLKLHAPQQHWEPKASGIRIRDKYAHAVRTLWEEHLAKQIPTSAP